MNRRKKRGGGGGRKLLAQTNKSSKMEEMNRGGEGGGIVSRLPLDITTEILSRLPADLLVQCCRRVCKYWRFVIDHPDFAYHHTLRQFGGKGHVSVYTLGSGTIGWRNKGEIPYNLLSIDPRPGLFANGAIHWYTYYGDHKKIVSFDLADEEFRVVVPLPPVPVPPSPDYINQLGVLGGCLCLTRSYTISKNIPRDVWIFNFNKEEEGKEKEFSWNRMFSIPGTWKKEITSQAEPCAFLKSGKVLLCGDHGITSYDPKTEAFYEGAWTFPVYYCGKTSILPYTKTFVSLKTLGEKDAKCFGRFVSLKGKSYFTEDFASEFGNLAFC